MHFPLLNFLTSGLPILTGTFSAVLKWIIHNGYPIIFLSAVIDGTTTTAAASFAATQGYFNLAYVFVLVLLGEIVGDFVWYTVGYFGRMALVKKSSRLFGLSEEKMEKLKKIIEKHPIKIIAAIKLSPFVPVPGLIVVGSSHLPPKKFVIIIGSIILPKTLLFIGAGYFFGHAYEKIYSYINNGIVAVIILAVVGFIFYRLYRNFSKKVSDKLEGK
jgi:membrane-associated protein